MRRTREVQVFFQAFLFCLNELNQGLQGVSSSILDVQGKIKAMLEKLELFKKLAKTGNVSVFPSLEGFLSGNDVRLADQVGDNIVDHLNSLQHQLPNMFSRREITVPH